MSAFTQLRTTVERFFVDTCTIRTSVAPAFDPDAGYSDDTGDTVYSGRCWVRPYRDRRVVEVGEDVTTLHLYTVRLPWDTTGVEVDQLVTVDTSDDPHMIGRVLRVVDVQGGSATPDRRLVCEDTLTQTVDVEEGGS